MSDIPVFPLYTARPMKRKKPIPTWLDDRLWTELLEPMLIGEPSHADRLARMWSYLLSEMEEGQDGVFRVRQCLENALRATFPFTKSYSACRARYERAL